MNCQRCHGLMVQDRLYDLQDSDVHCDVWRCVCCGNLLDTLILLNHRNWLSRHQPEKDLRSTQPLRAA